LLFLAVLCWKIFNATFSIDFGKIDFSDLLALILAIFAVSLSAAFYFKDSDASNKFYDNIYKFTKDTSEILGRIEAGFGEKLRHIDEGYGTIRDKFEDLRREISSTKEKFEEEEQEINKEENKKQNILEELASKAKLAEDEKVELFKQLKEKDDKIQEAQLKLRQYDRKLRKLIRLVGDNDDRSVGIFKHYVLREIRGLKTKDDIDLEFKKIAVDFPPWLIEDLQESKLINEKRELTEKGRSIIEMEI